MTSQKIANAIEALAEKATDAEALHAMQYAQAALNLANALSTLKASHIIE